MSHTGTERRGAPGLANFEAFFERLMFHAEMDLRADLIVDGSAHLQLKAEAMVQIKTTFTQFTKCMWMLGVGAYAGGLTFDIGQDNQGEVMVLE